MQLKSRYAMKQLAFVLQDRPENEGAVKAAIEAIGELENQLREQHTVISKLNGIILEQAGKILELESLLGQGESTTQTLECEEVS